MDELKLLMDGIGWLGALSLLSAYLLVSNGKIEPKTFLYQGLNIFGSFCLIANTYYYGTMSLVFLNSVWALIGIAVLINKSRIKL
ncbi:MAG: hypothetical protein HOH18_05540 [Kordiimonadaceae bacterium]|jgi:hypothetical protein|nr:hypothetical protein [Kordiimonadaceae bacterium]MBT6035922.1 hypothetical protein [Kordiimonadaceae bacterium]MBT7581801.1 hypothetical protein [Kordiimonadaceae bacterium]